MLTFEAPGQSIVPRRMLWSPQRYAKPFARRFINSWLSGWLFNGVVNSSGNLVIA
ncbi:hypothetical protein BO94DRAFT_532495 [Aspergillus sclerotioniger CBS 115572]|uniref:Uncharacterized protein n=1 Tax=Aspergillus sclerotioniger CBS 115572 TaxID=1450535 RepID=A0A317X5E8_9EURO|nr:hypothetical protein BO94DRAFT_532495 [Aspergillus sclerotioniger CBS 115572]PWY93555.1 hypothetical protein BO94DRAFT_532495 [Aspergillus sclerotioniger CBS 115572]